MDRRTYPSEPLAALTSLYRDGGLTVATGRPAIPTPVGRAVGGTTVINSGTCFRTPEPVLASWVAEHGIDWAGDLDPDYSQAEEMLAVRAVDTERMGLNGKLLRAGAEALGVGHGALRRNAGGLRAVQLLPDRMPPRREARDARFLPAARGRRRRQGAGRSRGAPGDLRARASGGGRLQVRGRVRRSGAPVHGPRPAWRRPQPAAPSGLPSSCSARAFARRAGRWDATCGSIRRAGSVHDSTRRSAAGTASCRATPSTSGSAWGSCSRRPSHRSPSAASGCPGVGDRAPGTPARIRQHRIDGRSPLRQVLGPGRPRPRRLAADQLPARPGRRRPARLRDRPRRGAATTRRARRRSTRRSPAWRSSTAARSRRSRPPPAPRGASPRGLSSDGDRPHGRRPAARGDRHRRRRARREAPLRRRRLAAAELDRGQPDDDDHRDGIPGRRRGSPPRRRRGGRLRFTSPPGARADTSLRRPGPEAAEARPARSGPAAGRPGRRTRCPPPASRASRRRRRPAQAISPRQIADRAADVDRRSPSRRGESMIR